MTSQVFVSYSRDDSQFVRRLVDDLTKRGVDIWLDVRDILASERWDSEVQEALRESDFFMIVLSPTSAGSENVQDEIAYALSKKKRVFPILYQDCDIPFRLARVQYVDFRQDYPAGLELLLEQMAIFGVPISAEPRRAPTAGEQTPASGETTPGDSRQPPDRGGGGLRKVLLSCRSGAGWLARSSSLVWFWSSSPPGMGSRPPKRRQSPLLLALPKQIPQKPVRRRSRSHLAILPHKRYGDTIIHLPRESPSPTSSPSPTHDPFTSRGDCVDYTPPCDYTVFPLDFSPRSQ